MNSIIKKSCIAIAFLFLITGCIIHNPQPDNCDIKTIVVTKIYEGGVKDIVFAEENGDFYYINRGLEMGYTIPELEAQVLNKKVTLHLANVITGTSRHIAQLTHEDTIIYTEFKQ